MSAIRCYTKHGLRAHYQRHDLVTERGGITLCDRDAYTLEQRSRFFRRRLRMASMCYVCEKLEEAMGK